MKVFLVRPRKGINATGEYTQENHRVTVLKGSVISEKVTYTEKFRGAKTIEKNREGVVKDRVLIKDMTFKSASTAANFVTGGSTNGLIAWKTADGRTLKELLQSE